MKGVKGLLLLVFALTAGCLSREPATWNDAPRRAETTEVAQDDLLKHTKALTVWSYFDMESTNAAFRAKFPDVALVHTQFDYEDFADVYVKALISGQTPDVMVIDNGSVGRFNSIRDAFDNLLEPPYDGEKYVGLIPPNMRNLYYSFDGSKLMGIPQNITGAVTFYRQDIFDRYGLPSEPEEVAAYFDDPDNWIEAGRRMKKEGRSIFQWDTDPLDILAMQESFFDSEYRYVRNKPSVGALLESARAVRQQGLSLRSSIWTEAGQEAIRSGELAAVYMGSWGIADLRRWAPDTAGKWRVTRLPAGLYGSTGGSLLSIPAQSRNKALAWEYVQMATDVDKEKDVQDDIAFLGGQDMTTLFEELPYRSKMQTPSPFDQQAQKIWSDAIIDAVATDTSPDFILRDIQLEIEDAVAEERRAILDYVRQRNFHPNS